MFFLMQNYKRKICMKHNKTTFRRVFLLINFCQTTNIRLIADKMFKFIIGISISNSFEIYDIFIEKGACVNIVHTYLANFEIRRISRWQILS